MDKVEAIRQLPTAYAVALRLQDAGADDTLIAAALDVEPEAVGGLLEIAAAKLDHVAASPRGGPGGSLHGRD